MLAAVELCEQLAGRPNALGLDAILIVSARSFVERRRHVAAQLARLGLRGEFIDEDFSETTGYEFKTPWDVEGADSYNFV